MKLNLFAALLFTLVGLENVAAEPVHHWPLDSAQAPRFSVRGSVAVGAGIDENPSLVLDGVSILEIPQSASLTNGDAEEITGD